MRILTGILAGALLAGTSVAAMAQTNGWYAGAETGVNFVPDFKPKIEGEKFKAKTDPGFGLLGQVGYGFGAVRVEGELGWRQNGMDKLAGYKAKGDLDALTLMANVYYDFNTGTAWTPYVGAGVGGAYLTADDIHPQDDASLKMDKSDTVFAYQGIAGVSYALNDNLSIKGDYRYLGTTDAKFKLDNSAGKAKFDYASHAIMVGFTYKFGETPKPAPVMAAAPVAPAPAPAPKMTQAPVAHQYQVFFDFNKSNITPEANRIIEQAAASAKASSATTISLVGHTDAVGSEKYNMALSLRRANAVKAVLAKLGIPANEISVVGKGKADQLVPTADGVREPQNRRVQIILP